MKLNSLTSLSVIDYSTSEPKENERLRPVLMCGCIVLTFAQKHVKLLEVSRENLVVELVLHLVLVFELVFVGLFEVLGKNDVSVLSEKGGEIMEEN